MTKNLETLAPRPETIKHLQSAFPSYLSKDVEAVVAILPTCFLEPTQYDVGPITISGELIHIPSRIYSPEPRPASLYGLSAQELVILACIYTRHHDGFIRQKYLEKLFSQDEIWVCPFVLQLIGEYVVEIIEGQYTENCVNSNRKTWYPFQATKPREENHVSKKKSYIEQGRTSSIHS